MVVLLLLKLIQISDKIEWIKHLRFFRNIYAKVIYPLFIQ